MHGLSFKTIKQRSNWGALNRGYQCIPVFSDQLRVAVRLQIRSGSQAPTALTGFVTSGDTQWWLQTGQRKLCSFYLHNWARRKDFGFDVGLAGRTTDGCEEAHGIFGRDRLSSTRLPTHDDGLVLLIPVAAQKKSFCELIHFLVNSLFTSHNNLPSSRVSVSLVLLPPTLWMLNLFWTLPK